MTTTTTTTENNNPTSTGTIPFNEAGTLHQMFVGKASDGAGVLRHAYTKAGNLGINGLGLAAAAISIVTGYTPDMDS